MYKTSEIVPFETDRPLGEGIKLGYEGRAKVIRPRSEEEKHIYEQTQSVEGKLIGVYDFKRMKMRYVPYKKVGLTTDHITRYLSWEDKSWSREMNYFMWYTKKRRDAYVVPEIVDGLVLFRIFILQSTFPTTEERITGNFKQATLFELFRVVMDGPECWEENYKGELNTSVFGGDKRYAPPFNMSWIDEENYKETIGRILSKWGVLQDKVIHPIPVFHQNASCGYLYGIMGLFKRIPKKTWMDKSVPEVIRHDLKQHQVFAEKLGRSLIEGFVVEHSPGCRIYLGAKKLYAFLANPFDGKWTQIRPNKRLNDDPRVQLICREEKTETPEALALYEKVGGLATLTYRAAIAAGAQNPSHERLYNLAYTWAIYRYKAIEQAEKVGKPYIAWHLAGASTRSARRVVAPYRTDLMKNKSLETVLGVPGKAIKYIQEDYGRVQDLCVKREERNAAFEIAAKDGFPIDKVYYFKVGGGNWRLDKILIWMAEAGKDVRPILRNMEHVRKNGWDKKNLGNAYLGNKDLGIIYLEKTYNLMIDYVRMVAVANEVAATPYPAFPPLIKLNKLKTLHDNVMRDYNRAKSVLSSDGVLFQRMVAKEEYHNLCDQEEKENFCVLAPEKPMDLVEEGNALGHCVGSYVSYVEDGSTIILLLRHKNEPKRPYCTMEVQKNGSILSLVQCYNAHNTHDGNKDRVSYIKQWAKRKGVNIACAI